MIAVIDYGVGNLFSVEKALLQFGVKVAVTSDPNVIRQANKLVLPGVGAFGDCMKNLEASGLIPTIREMIDAGYPLLGICVGLQILFEGSEESPEAQGLGIFKGQVRKIHAPELKIPHMGWNSLTIREPRQRIDLFHGLAEHPYVYFVHSYHVTVSDPGDVIALTSYGGDFPSAIGRGNVFGTQFHPEKSQNQGLRLLRNFCEL